jgi:hypothetical protein
MSDPKVGTGKKPKGSGRRLYTDENPKDTLSIKFSSLSDVKQTIKKIERQYKAGKIDHKRASQIAQVLEQRIRFMKNKPADRHRLAKKYTDFLKQRTKMNSIDRKKLKFS